MAYDDKLANKVREKLADLPNVVEKRMMGGLIFMYNDKMCVGIFKDQLMCRVDAAMHAALVEKQGCKTMVFGGRSMIGYILIDETGMRTKQEFDFWINLTLEFNKYSKQAKKKIKKA